MGAHTIVSMLRAAGVMFWLGLAVVWAAQYQQPPKAIIDGLTAPLTPLVSVSPQRSHAVFMQPVRYPPLREVAQPMLRLAGVRIDTETNGLHLPRTFTSFSVKRLGDGTDISITLPQAAKLSAPLWSPDGKRFTFTNTTAHGIELWVATTETGQSRCLPGVTVNGVVPGSQIEINEPVLWMGDNHTLLVRTIPEGRGSAPTEAAVPSGPNVQQSLGKSGPAPTFEDLLKTPHDEDLFDFYATAQLTYIDVDSGTKTALAKPGVYTAIKPSPDQKHLLVEQLHRPYSYQLPAEAFPVELEIWSRNGTVEHAVASLPLAEHIPLAGVRTGPRSAEWIQQEPATLTWVEALDGGNPREMAPNRDRGLALAAPFSGTPREIFKTKERFRGLQTLSDGKALVEDYERVKRTVRTLEINLAEPNQPPRVIFARNERDSYHDPGKLVMKTLPDGRLIPVQSREEVYLSGPGATPAGDKPFVDRFNLATGKAERLFQSSGSGYEAVVDVLDDHGGRLLTRRESPTEPPNYFIRSGSDLKQLTHFANPYPAAARVTKQLVTYQRADGVPLSFTLYLPPDYKQGSRIPALLWAYPYEFTDAATAGQVTGHSAQAFPELNYHQLVVMGGYALVDNAAMPIVGDADTVNNTYVEQLQMDGQAAIDKLVEMGVADRDHIGVFGHSYGAFMTANLLAHTTLFRAGVAESGAYNRTLTPFGFQAERRTFWEAPDIYEKMSPFFYADKIKTPLLLIHGEADDNTGTFPIQSERFYSAIRGNGGVVRLVMLPSEAHGYRGLESMEDVLFEELRWFDTYLK